MEIKPRYDKDGVTLYCADCLDVMPQMEPGSMDAIITDLPYGTTQCSWDEIIPFVPMWECIKQVLQSKGTFITTANQPFTSKLIMSNLDWFRQELIWDKVLPVGFLDANRRHMRQHENILVFSGNGYHTYIPQMTKRGVPRWKGGSNSDRDQIYGKYKKLKTKNNDYYPTTIITATNGDRTRPELTGHPTQKPVSLYRYLVRTYTNPDAIVLDMCMGSGTTGVACVQLGRRFIGIEINEKYYQIAEKRIREAQLQINMPLEFHD